MAAGRAKNTATADVCVKILRGNHPSLDAKAYLDEGLEAVVETYADCMCDLLNATDRPTKALLISACMDAYDCSLPQAESFAGRLVAGFKVCRRKTGGFTTGAKLPAGQRKVVKLLKQQQNESPHTKTLGEQFVDKARQLQRESSSPKKPSTNTPAESVAIVDSWEDSQSSSALRKQKKALFKKLGLSDSESECKPRLPGAPWSPMQVSVSSSADEHDEPEAPKAQPMSKTKAPSASSKGSHGEHVQYWDNAKNAFVRLVGDSEVEATLALGPKGFLTARFPDEEPIDIEVQNCMLGLEFKKRKQVCKKPASDTKKKIQDNKTSEKKDC